MVDFTNIPDQSKQLPLDTPAARKKRLGPGDLRTAFYFSSSFNPFLGSPLDTAANRWAQNARMGQRSFIPQFTLEWIIISSITNQLLPPISSWRVYYINIHTFALAFQCKLSFFQFIETHARDKCLFTDKYLSNGSR